MPQHSKDRLADALAGLDLTEMAERARTGYYHDFLSPLALPALQLMHDLAEAAANRPERASDVMKLRRRAMEGEFGASSEESDEWAKSPDGQETFRRLTKDMTAKHKFQIGQPVFKWTGDFTGRGIVRGIAANGAGKVRYLVGHKVEGGTGEFLHIYAEGNLREHYDGE
jgi:hypothetical protein